MLSQGPISWPQLSLEHNVLTDQISSSFLNNEYSFSQSGMNLTGCFASTPATPSMYAAIFAQYHASEASIASKSRLGGVPVIPTVRPSPAFKPMLPVNLIFESLSFPEIPKLNLGVIDTPISPVALLSSSSLLRAKSKSKKQKARKNMRERLGRISIHDDLHPSLAYGVAA